MKIKRILCIITAVLMAIPFISGCDGYKKEYIYFNLNEMPNTVDPQTAKTDSELLIVRNLYEGLLRRAEDGSIVCGACEDYEENGYSYTFNIKENLKWSNGDELTAKDFVFAFSRAVDRRTESPFVSRLFSIVNAQAIYEGRADISSLGVEATDSKTLTITLAKPDEDFLNTLTTSICMPCNQSFFEDCVGKYGLEKDYVIANGSYYMGKWNKDEFGIRLYRNEKYGGSFKANNAAVFLSCNDEESNVDFLGRSVFDIAFINSGELNDAKQKGIKVSSVENVCWVLTVSSEYSFDIREAFARLVSGEVYETQLNSGCRVADSIYPAVFNAGDNVSLVGFTPYDKQSARDLFSAAVAKYEDKNFPPATIYYFDTPEIKPVITAVAGHLQQNLSAFINIESSDSLETLQNELKQKTLQFAVFPVSVSSGSVNEYVLKYGISSVGDLGNIQASLLKDKTLLPLFFESTNIGYTNQITTFKSDTQNGYIDFAYVIKNGK